MRAHVAYLEVHLHYYWHYEHVAGADEAKRNDGLLAERVAPFRSRNWKADLGGVQVAKRPMMDVHFSFTVVALVSVMIAINPELGSKA